MVNKIHTGKMEMVLKDFPDNSIDSIVTDPPYGLSFMGKHWDYDVPTVEQWQEAYRVLKPGGFLLSFGGTRTYHRMVVNIEDAGFEIRDQIQWLYGSGFPKSLDISKAIDKMAGAEREVVGNSRAGSKERKGYKGDMAIMPFKSETIELDITKPSTDAAKEWEGWGTALKPANEPICVARKPVEGTVANNVLKWGTGGLNIDGGRISVSDNDPNHRETKPSKSGDLSMFNIGGINYGQNDKGRFPANVILDKFMGGELDKQTGLLKSGTTSSNDISSVKSLFNGIADDFKRQDRNGDEGGASRFFYCPKPDNFERNKGLKGFEKKQSGMISNTSGQHITRRDGGAPKPKANHHPTVKPIDLMRYLVKLVTPKGGTCLDPFVGSGTTLIGCKMELINFIGIDMDPENTILAEARVKAWNPDLYKAQQLF